VATAVAHVKEQGAKIQGVSARVKVSRPAPQMPQTICKAAIAA